MAKLIKKGLVVFLVITMVLSIVGCGNTEKEQTTTPETKKEETKKLDPMAISIGYWGAGDKFNDNDPILKDLQDKFNIKLEGKNVTWSDYSEKYKLWAAAGELPDIFAMDAINTETFETWVNQGVIRPLPSDLSRYPNIQKIMQQSDVKPLARDGAFYNIPRLTYPATDMWALDRGVLVRKDWLDKLGLKIPKTFEEYKTVLKAFVENDPDGNGVNDTIGLTHRAVTHLAAFFLGSVPQVTNDSWVKEDGRWIPGYYSKNMIKGVKELKEFYDEGLLDRDFAIMQTNDGLEKFAQGQAGMITQQIMPNALKLLEDKWVKYDHGIDFADAVAIVPFWAAEDGNNYSFTQTTYWSESYFSGNVDDKKMERILMLYDYLKSDKFTTIKTYGIEGVDYQKNGDQYKILLEKDETGRYPSLIEKYPCLAVLTELVAWDQQNQLIDNELNKVTYGEGIMKMAIDFSKARKDEIVPTPTNFDVKLLVTPAKTKLSVINFFDDVTKVIISDGNPEEEWEKVREGYKAYGVEEAIKEVNEKVAEMGIE